MKKILAIPGSTRTASSNWKLLKLIADLFKEEIELEIYDQMADLPHFDPDVADGAQPEIVRRFFEKINRADGIIVCSPEYVFSPPAILKNALEWTVSETILSYKPMALIVASSLGEKTFESLDLILKTLLQSEIPAASKILIQGKRTQIEAFELGTENELSGQVSTIIKSLLEQIENPAKA